MNHQNTVTHGRPPKPDDKKRKFVIQSKLTRAEYDSVVASAAAASLSTYEYMRRAVLNRQGVTTLRPEDWSLFKEFLEALRHLEASIDTAIERCDESNSKIAAVELLRFLSEIKDIKALFINKMQK